MRIFDVEKNQFHWSIRICLLLSFFLLIYLYGCESDRIANEDRRENKKAAINACIERGGIPMLDGWGNMTECKFPPCSEVKK